jgi:hypothetical protein
LGAAVVGAGGVGALPRIPNPRPEPLTPTLSPQAGRGRRGVRRSVYRVTTTVVPTPTRS